VQKHRWAGADIADWAFRTQHNNPGRWSFCRISDHRRWPVAAVLHRTPRGAMEQITGTKRNATQAGLPTATSLAPSRGAGDHGETTHAASSAMDEDNTGTAELDPQRRDLLRQLEDIERERLALQQGVLFRYSQDACSVSLAHWASNPMVSMVARSGIDETAGLARQRINLQMNCRRLGRRLPLCACRLAPAVPAEMQRV